MVQRNIHSTKEFANLIKKLLRSDRDVNMAVGGFTGVGKSTFSAQVQMSYAEQSGTEWDFDRMTWDRDELMKWIDGEGDSKEGQLPEYSAILADELFLLFFSRNWYDREQIDSISVFNMCRDRHLFIAGNVPNFWEIDGAFRERMRFYAYIPERGLAWVFEQERNPFSKDPWNVRENQRKFRRYGHPYKCPNFAFEVRFDDFSPDQKSRYLDIRNKKRVKAVDDKKLKRDSKKMTKKEVVLGRAILALSESMGMAVSNVSEKVLFIDRSTGFHYTRLAKAEESMRSAGSNNEK